MPSAPPAQCKLNGDNKGQCQRKWGTDAHIFFVDSPPLSRDAFRPVSGLVSGVRLNCRLPMRVTQWHSDNSFTYLPLRGQRRIWLGRTDFPFNRRV